MTMHLPTVPEEPWMEAALCRQTDPEVFWPEKGGDPKPAKAICKLCPVQDDCLTYALDHEERWGIWGGQSEAARVKLRQARNRALPMRRCDICDRPYRHQSAQQRLCSDACRLIARRRTSNGRYERKLG